MKLKELILLAINLRINQGTSFKNSLLIQQNGKVVVVKQNFKLAFSQKTWKI